MYTLDPAADWTTLPPAVRRGIAAADPADAHPRDWQSVCLALHDDEGNVVGGAYGATMWSWLMIDGLWVAPDLRGQGHGQRLLLTSENIAIGRGCVGSWLGTFDFQARDFYVRNGYTVLSELPGFPPGHTHYHLSKRFDVAGG